VPPPDLPKDYRSNRDVWLYVSGEQGVEELSWCAPDPDGPRWRGPVPLRWNRCRELLEHALKQDLSDWTAPGTDDAGTVLDILKELRGTTQHDQLPRVHATLGRAVTALLPPETRGGIEGFSEGWRWVLEVEPGCLAALVPWEAWQAQRAPITTARTALVRYCRAAGRPEPLSAPREVRVLILVGNVEQHQACGGAGGALKAELEGLRKTLGYSVSVTLASAKGTVEVLGGKLETELLKDEAAVLHLLGQPSPDLPPAQPPHVVHYVGHSMGEMHAARGLDFGGGVGQVPFTSIAAALTGGPTRLVVLHACAVPDPVARELAGAVEHVVAMGARVTPDFTALVVGPLYRALFPDSLSVSEGVAAARRAVLASQLDCARDRGWVLGHWTRFLEDRPFLDREAQALRQHVAGELARLRNFEGFFERNAPGNDALEQLTVLLHLEGIERSKAGPASTLDGSMSLTELIEEFPRQFPERRRFILLRADPGAGKTTCLRMAARRLALSSRPFVYARLRDWKRTEGRLHDLQTEYPVFSGAAENGELVVLLDGWDECDDKSEIEAFLASGLPPGDITVVVSTRTIHVDKQLPAGDWMHCTLEALSSDQQQQVLAAWYRAAGEADPEDRARECLADLPLRIRELCEIPLYLALTAYLVVQARVKLDVDSEPHQLFERFFRMVLKQGHREQSLPEGLARFLETPTDGMPALDLLSILALEYVALGERDLSREEVIGLLDSKGRSPRFLGTCGKVFEDLKARLDSAGWSLVTLVGKIADSSELLAGDSTGFGFDRTHKTFREALAARALGRIAYPAGGLQDLQGIVDSFLDGELDDRQLSVWAEVLAMVTGWIQADEKESWVKWLLEVNPRLGYRALSFGAGIGNDLLVSILGLGAQRAERWKTYEGRLGIGSHPVADSIEAAEGLVEALRKIRPSGPGPAEGEADTDHREVVPDLAMLDDQLRQLELEPGADDTESRARIEGVRQRILEVVGAPAGGALAKHFGSTGVTGPDRKWAQVPAGSFRMGSPEEEEGRFDNEDQVEVQLPGFWIGRTTVTLEQYRLFDRDKRHRWGERGNIPVTEVSWYEAALFCRWLERYGGALKSEDTRDLAFQLPSEAMWEYAARDAPGLPGEGEKGYPRFVTGDSELSLAAVAWFGLAFADGPRPVATKEAGEQLSLYDMHGNIWEWCRDWFSRELEGGGNPQGPVQRPSRDARRVLRGGSYRSDARYCRSAYRNGGLPAVAYGNLGFRVVLAPRPPR
jgi:formylglycine-generating enzyme required for sulfatase activity